MSALSLSLSSPPPPPFKRFCCIGTVPAPKAVCTKTERGGSGYTVRKMKKDGEMCFVSWSNWRGGGGGGRYIHGKVNKASFYVCLVVGTKKLSEHLRMGPILARAVRELIITSHSISRLNYVKLYLCKVLCSSPDFSMSEQFRSQVHLRD